MLVMPITSRKAKATLHEVGKEISDGDSARTFTVIVGFLVGGYIGFSLRPSAPFARPASFQFDHFRRRELRTCHCLQQHGADISCTDSVFCLRRSLHCLGFLVILVSKT